MSDNKLRAIKARWQGQEFSFVLSQRCINEYLLTDALSNLGGNEELHKVIAYINLLKLVIMEFRTVFSGISLEESDQELDLTSATALELAPDFVSTKDVMLEVLLVGKIEPIMMHYSANKLKLAKVSSPEFSFACSDKEHSYNFALESTVSISKEHTSYIGLSLLVNGNNEEVFIPKVVIEYLYEFYYNREIQFEFDQYHIELVVSRINLILAQVKDVEIQIDWWKFSKLKPSGEYIKIKFMVDQLHGHFLLREDNRALLELLQSKNQQKPKEAIDDALINLSIVSHYIETTIDKLNQLKKGDVLISPQRVNQDVCYLDLGENRLELNKNGAKLVVAGLIRE